MLGFVKIKNKTFKSFIDISESTDISSVVSGEKMYSEKQMLEIFNTEYVKNINGKVYTIYWYEFGCLYIFEDAFGIILQGDRIFTYGIFEKSIPKLIEAYHNDWLFDFGEEKRNEIIANLIKIDL